jgi:hypothetical protein
VINHPKGPVVQPPICKDGKNLQNLARLKKQLKISKAASSSCRISHTSDMANFAVARQRTEGRATRLPLVSVCRRIVLQIHAGILYMGVDQPS